MKTFTIHRQRGQELVEYSLILSILLMIVIVLFDVGRLVYYYSSLQNAAREGARYGIIDPDMVKIEAIASDRAIGLDPAHLSVSACRFNQDLPVPDCDPSGDAVRVVVQFDFTPFTPLAGFFLGLATESESITLSGQATMHIEE